MLKQMIAKPCHSIVRRLAVPIFYKSQLFALLPMIVLCSIVLSISRNVSLFIFLISLGYVSYAISMQRFVPYCCDVPSNLLENTINLLDTNHKLSRISGTLKWRRRLSLQFGQTELDTVEIKSNDGGYIVVGMKKYIEWLANELDAELQ